MVDEIINQILDFLNDNSVLISIFATIISLFISFIVLYLAHLRGPKIIILEKKIKAKLKDEFDRWGEGLTRIDLEPIFIIFANVGNRSGMVTDFDVEFNLKKEIETILKGEPYSWWKQDDAILEVLILEERGIKRLQVIIGFNFLPYFNKQKWEELPTDKIPEDTTIEDIAKVYEKATKMECESFLKSLRSLNTLGTMNIKYRKTVFPLLRKDTLKSEKITSITIDNIIPKTIQFLEEQIGDWENLQPKQLDIIVKLVQGMQVTQDGIEKCNNDISDLQANVMRRLHTITWKHVNLFRKIKPEVTETFETLQNIRDELDYQIKSILELGSNEIRDKSIKKFLKSESQRSKLKDFQKIYEIWQKQSQILL